MVSGNDKSPDAHETEAEIAVVLNTNIVILDDPRARGAKPAPRCPFLHEPPASVPQSLFHLFYLVEIRHRQPLQSQLHPLTGAGAQEITMRIWRLHDYLFVKPRREQRATGRPRELASASRCSQSPFASSPVPTFEPQIIRIRGTSALQQLSSSPWRTRERQGARAKRRP
jgi:hypothetical protein